MTSRNHRWYFGTEFYLWRAKNGVSVVTKPEQNNQNNNLAFLAKNAIISGC